MADQPESGLGIGPRVLPEHPGDRRRLLVRSGLRILGITLGMLLLYAFVPVPGSSGAAAFVGM
ncbi:MAG: hypothetical protein ACTHLH_01145, partial [Solirubrobacterales bacterium]